VKGGANKLSECKLVERSIQGDETAFAELLSPYIKNARKTAYLLLHDYSLAEDAVQEAMLQTYNSMSRYDSKKSLFKTWFNGIVVNCALKISRKKRFWLKMGEEPSHHNTPERKQLHDEESKYVYSCIKRLTFKLRTVIILHYYQELSIEEIAETLDINDGTVKSRLFNARKKLKKMINENPDLVNGMGGNTIWNKN
jgi:RNA polymerase sigma factor (sigma-70 family)